MGWFSDDSHEASAYATVIICLPCLLADSLIAIAIGYRPPQVWDLPSTPSCCCFVRGRFILQIFFIAHFLTGAASLGCQSVREARRKKREARLSRAGEGNHVRWLPNGRTSILMTSVIALHSAVLPLIALPRPKGWICSTFRSFIISEYWPARLAWPRWQGESQAPW